MHTHTKHNTKNGNYTPKTTHTPLSHIPFLSSPFQSSSSSILLWDIIAAIATTIPPLSSLPWLLLTFFSDNIHSNNILMLILSWPSWLVIEKNTSLHSSHYCAMTNSFLRAHHHHHAPNRYHQHLNFTTMEFWSLNHVLIAVGLSGLKDLTWWLGI